MLRRALFLTAALSIFAPAAQAACIVAVVDFQRAVTETDEGKAAQTKLDTMYATRKSEIEKLQSDLEKEFKEYEQKALILSDDARKEAEQNLLVKQQRFESTYGQYQQEMQQAYFTLLQELDNQMRTLSASIAKEKTYCLVLDKAAVVYAGGEAIEMTDELIRRYNAAH